mgnify:CR=1 FL=1
MIECCLSIAPRAEKNTIQAPWPPTTPTIKSITVAANEPKFAMRREAAKRWAAVIKIPPIKIVFLGPYLL